MLGSQNAFVNGKETRNQQTSQVHWNGVSAVNLSVNLIQFNVSFTRSDESERGNKQTRHKRHVLLVKK